MSLFLDLFPLAAFFIAYKLYGVYAATGALMVAVVLQLLIHWVRTKEIKKMYVATAALAVVFGSITILLRDPRFIQWKFTIVYWLFSVTFASSFLWGKKPLVQTMLEATLNEAGSGKVDINSNTWRNLNWIWALFFLTLGGINIYIFQNFSMDTWTNFKVFWSTGAFFAFILANIVWLFRYLPDEETES